METTYNRAPERRPYQEQPELTGAALFETATQVSGAVFWQTGGHLCGRRRKHENARLIFCEILKKKGASRYSISRILNRRPTEIKAMSERYRERRQENRLFDIMGRKVWNFCNYGADD